jgi:hypothetical protein
MSSVSMELRFRPPADTESLTRRGASSPAAPSASINGFWEVVMPIGVAVLLATVVVAVLWTSVLLTAELIRCTRERKRIDNIARRIDELMSNEASNMLPTGRHRLRSPRHA